MSEANEFKEFDEGELDEFGVPLVDAPSRTGWKAKNNPPLKVKRILTPPEKGYTDWANNMLMDWGWGDNELFFEDRSKWQIELKWLQVKSLDLLNNFACDNRD